MHSDRSRDKLAYCCYLVKGRQWNALNLWLVQNVCNFASDEIVLTICDLSVSLPMHMA